MTVVCRDPGLKVTAKSFRLPQFLLQKQPTNVHKQISSRKNPHNIEIRISSKLHCWFQVSNQILHNDKDQLFFVDGPKQAQIKSKRPNGSHLKKIEKRSYLSNDLTNKNESGLPATYWPSEAR